MSTPIFLFLLIGAVFGLATGSHQHLFSEGPTRRSGAPVTLASRLLWVLISTALWPLLLLTGMLSLRRARVRAAKPPQRRR
jgi:hypothetical protein